MLTALAKVQLQSVVSLNPASAPAESRLRLNLATVERLVRSKPPVTVNRSQFVPVVPVNEVICQSYVAPEFHIEDVAVKLPGLFPGFKS